MGVQGLYAQAVAIAMHMGAFVLDIDAASDMPAVACVDTGRSFDCRHESALVPAEPAAPRCGGLSFGDAVGDAAAAALAAAYAFEWTSGSTLVFLHQHHLRDRALLFDGWGAEDSTGTVRAALDAGAAAPLEILAIPAIGGAGCFAAARIGAGDLVVEYAGLVEPETAPFDAYAIHYAETLNAESLHLSAREFGNAARFVNHDAAPNADFRRVVHRGLLRVVIVATAPIDVGDQVFVDYGASYWRASPVDPAPLPRTKGALFGLLR